jgi:hypothetical protein
MEVLVRVGFDSFPLYVMRIKPALECIMADDARTLPLNRTGGDERDTRVSMTAKLSRMFVIKSIWEFKTVDFWALVLTTALLADHLYWSLSMAVNSGPSTISPWLDGCFQEFIGMPHLLCLTLGCCFSVSFLNTVCHQGLEAVPALMQLGICAFWVYGVVRNVTLLGVLAWSFDVRLGLSFTQHLMETLFADHLFILPALGLHLTLAAARPAVLLLYCARPNLPLQSVRANAIVDPEGPSAPLPPSERSSRESGVAPMDLLANPTVSGQARVAPSLPPGAWVHESVWTSYFL